MHMDDIREFVTTKVSDIVEAKDLLNRLLAIAQPEAVFGEPIEVGEQKIITASEVTAGLGFGFGAGGGAAEPGEAKGRVLVAQNGPSVVPEADEEAEKTSGDVEASGMGGGGGGGGGASGRPVAVISITPNDVRVVPVIDQTRILLAMLSTLAAIVLMLGKLRRMARS
jgi:uncharacterized spore protein YtfJ